MAKTETEGPGPPVVRIDRNLTLAPATIGSTRPARPGLPLEPVATKDRPASCGRSVSDHAGANCLVHVLPEQS